MNENLQKLVKQATHDVLGVKQLDSVILAELIVRECAAICESRKLTPSTFTSAELLEHFGIQE